MPRTRRYARDQRAADALATALTGLPDDWVMCRDMRHAWTVVNDFHVTDRRGKRIMMIARELGCMRCATLRKENYVHNGYGLDKVSQHYVYPDGYQMKGVPRGVKPQAIIQEEQFRRTMERLADSAKDSDERMALLDVGA